MKKSFKQMCSQLERIYKCFEKGYGTRNMVARAESFIFGGRYDIAGQLF